MKSSKNPSKSSNEIEISKNVLVQIVSFKTRPRRIAIDGVYTLWNFIKLRNEREHGILIDPVARRNLFQVVRSCKLLHSWASQFAVVSTGTVTVDVYTRMCWTTPSSFTMNGNIFQTVYSTPLLFLITFRSNWSFLEIDWSPEYHWAVSTITWPEKRQFRFLKVYLV